MQRSHFYRGSNGCRCRLPISERLYSIWTNIKTRCNNPNSTCSKYYHDRGIQGSGKTTWAKNYCNEHPNSIRVNRDDLRAMMGCKL